MQNASAASRRGRFTRLLTPFRDFSHTEVAGGIVLLLVTVLALVWANSPWSDSYHDLWAREFAIELSGWFSLSMSLHHWINDGLMVIFFFVVGLEIKREVLVGELSTLRHALLPVVAAAGGAITPALIFLSLNAGTEYSRGWGIPMATDIAFALGVLALLGNRVPFALKIFLAALAIVDDVMAVLVIAVFYTEDLAPGYLLLGGAVLAALFLANRMQVRQPALYAVAGLVVWWAFLESGVHATIAGVLLAMTIPLRASINADEFAALARHNIDVLSEGAGKRSDVLATWDHQRALEGLRAITNRAESTMQQFLRALHSWVAFLIVPLFALSNVGISLGDSFGDAVTSTLGIGIILGLIVGKQVGILGSAWLMVRLNVATLPFSVRFSHIYGASCLAGIGFTMSLFITELAFDAPARIEMAKMSILIASLISGIVGWIVLRRVSWPDRSAAAEAMHADIAVERAADAVESRELVGERR